MMSDGERVELPDVLPGLVIAALLDVMFTGNRKLDGASRRTASCARRPLSTESLNSMLVMRGPMSVPDFDVAIPFALAVMVNGLSRSVRGRVTVWDFAVCPASIDVTIPDAPKSSTPDDVNEIPSPPAGAGAVDRKTKVADSPVFRLEGRVMLPIEIGGGATVRVAVREALPAIAVIVAVACAVTVEVLTENARLV